MNIYVLYMYTVTYTVLYVQMNMDPCGRRKPALLDHKDDKGMDQKPVAVFKLDDEIS